MKVLMEVNGSNSRKQTMLWNLELVGAVKINTC